MIGLRDERKIINSFFRLDILIPYVYAVDLVLDYFLSAQTLNHVSQIIRKLVGFFVI